MINKREGGGINHFNDSKAFIEYSNDMCNVYKNVFDDMITDMTHNKKLDSIVTELFLRGRKLTISFVFITQSYFKVPKDVRLNTTHFFIAKILNKRELQQIAINHSSDISISKISIENVQLDRIRFWLMILHLHQIIL